MNTEPFAAIMFALGGFAFGLWASDLAQFSSRAWMRESLENWKRIAIASRIQVQDAHVTIDKLRRELAALKNQ